MGFASFAASRDLRIECLIRKDSGSMRLEQKQTERREVGIGWAGSSAGGARLGPSLFPLFPPVGCGVVPAAKLDRE